MRAYHLETFGKIEGIVLRDGGGPRPAPAGPTGIVVRVRTASLNRRDLLILHERYPLSATPGVIPLSDGAGEVVAAGEAVTRFAIGDRVSCAYFPHWRDGRITPELVAQPGCTFDGMLAEYALLDEQWAVRVPDHLTWEEAATLPCAAVTAWNALTGGEGGAPPAGRSVLTLGTGPVALFAVQFAKLLGCRVVSTTSDEEKERLRALGADAVVNYVRTPQWGSTVRELTGGGADLVVETGGPDTIEESVRASSLYGQIALLITASAAKSGIEISHEAYASSLAPFGKVVIRVGD